jgi:ribosomal protein S18 acetylase RimI-like enzyme
MMSISSPSADESTRVLSLLFQAMPTDDRLAQVDDMQAAVARGDFTLEGLLAARDGERLLGAAMYVPQADGTAFVWPAQTVELAESEQVADQLYEELARQIDAAGLSSSQAIVEVSASADRAALRRHGFRHLVDLFYLQRILTSDLPPRMSIEFEIIPFSPGQNEDRFARLIEQTYIDTLDCPGFHENRGGTEALASHRCSGEFSAERWNLYAIDGRDVGLLLMNDHPLQQAWEVVYVGVAAAARGNRYGRAMLIDGLHAAQQAGRQSVLLAVDATNGPANRIYDDLGFVEVASRAVHLRSKPASDGETQV